MYVDQAKENECRAEQNVSNDDSLKEKTDSINVQTVVNSESSDKTSDRGESETNENGDVENSFIDDFASEEDEDETNSKVKYVLNNNNFKDIQEGNHATRQLMNKVKNGVNSGKWREPCLRKYKRYSRQLKIKDGLLMRQFDNYESTVIPFSLMVEVVHKTHVQLGHIGMYKLKDIILKTFWHPSLDKTVHDICISCTHCQIFKVSNKTTKAPILKIEADNPFELVATDIMLLPKTPRKNIGVLVTIDHYSKWLTAIPIKDKKGSTVAKIFRDTILPNLPKLPTRILSDNGPEFKSEEFNRTLQQYNINHVYSTPYKASSNG